MALGWPGIPDASAHALYPQAFRQLSHRFHGKGSGKMKTERRMKKLDEEAVGLGREVGFLYFWVLCDMLGLLPLF